MLSMFSDKIVLTCSPSGTTSNLRVESGPCPSGHILSYESIPVLSQEAQSRLEAESKPFDYMVAAQFFSLSFSLTVMLYIVAKCGGAILGLLKSTT